jgi:hypothetical protein
MWLTHQLRNDGGDRPGDPVFSLHEGSVERLGRSTLYGCGFGLRRPYTLFADCSSIRLGLLPRRLGCRIRLDRSLSKKGLAPALRLGESIPGLFFGMQDLFELLHSRLLPD